MNDDGIRRECVTTPTSTRCGAFNFSQWENCLAGQSDPTCKYVSLELENEAQVSPYRLLVALDISAQNLNSITESSKHLLDEYLFNYWAGREDVEGCEGVSKNVW